MAIDLVAEGRPQDVAAAWAIVVDDVCDPAVICDRLYPFMSAVVLVPPPGSSADLRAFLVVGLGDAPELVDPWTGALPKHITALVASIGFVAASTSTPAPPSPPVATVTWLPPSVIAFAGPGNQFIEELAPWRDGFVGVGGECCGVSVTGIVWLSPDGLTWERVPDPADTFANLTLEHVLQVGNTLVLAAQGRADGPWGIWTSPDGRTWQPAATGADFFASATIRGLASGPAGVIAFGATRDGLPLLWQSQDGSAWALSTGTATLGADPVTVGATSWGYVATSYSGAWWSTDGEAWSTAIVEGSQHLSGIFVGRDGLLAGWSPERRPGVLGPILRPTFLQSSDGRSWHLLPSAEQPPPDNPGDLLVANGTTIVEVAQSGEIHTSTDGLSWTNVSVSSQGKLDAPGSTFHDFYRLALGAPGLVASGQGGSVRGDVDANVWVGLGTLNVPSGLSGSAGCGQPDTPVFPSDFRAWQTGPLGSPISDTPESTLAAIRAVGFAGQIPTETKGLQLQRVGLLPGEALLFFSAQPIDGAATLDDFYRSGGVLIKERRPGTGHLAQTVLDQLGPHAVEVSVGPYQAATNHFDEIAPGLRPYGVWWSANGSDWSVTAGLDDPRDAIAITRSMVCP
jgi:hypothetical protein